MLFLFVMLTFGKIFAEEATATAAPMPVKMGLEHFRIYKTKGFAGRVEYVKKSTENPMTRRKFVPDDSEANYVVQLYGHDPAALSDVKAYTLTITVSDDVNPEAEIGFSLKSKNKKYGWYGSIRAKNDVKKLTPGRHTLSTGTDLKNAKKLVDLGYLCPIITIRNLKSGFIIVESVEVVTSR